MRVAILSESTADEASLRVIVDALLGVKTIPVEKNLRSNGWTFVQGVLPTISKQLHYRTDTEALESGTGIFPRHFLPVVRAGEASGRQAESFQLLYQHSLRIGPSLRVVRNTWLSKGGFTPARSAGNWTGASPESSSRRPGNWNCR